jgi:hypothetical protein
VGKKAERKRRMRDMEINELEMNSQVDNDAVGKIRGARRVTRPSGSIGRSVHSITL